MARVRFDRWNGTSGEGEPETWERERTDTIAGRLVSVFQPAWSADVLQPRLASARIGPDRPYLYYGVFRGNADAPSAGRVVYLRVGSSLARSVEVVRIDDTVQYSSHLVNLVIPGFGDQRLATDYDLAAIGRKFYEHFEDSYEVLAIVPRAIHIDQFTAYHQTVQNQVNGIGKDRVSRFAQYGSAGTLLGVEAYHNISFRPGSRIRREAA